MNQRSVLVGICGAAVLAAAALTGVRSQPRPPAFARVKPHAIVPRLCATGNLTDREMEAIEQTSAAAEKLLGRRAAVPAQTPIGLIYVAFHVIYTYDGFVTDGLLTQAEVESQVAALNVAFNNVKFDLVRDLSGNPTSITYTNNFAWFAMIPGSVEELQAKTALHWDSSKYLNVYSVLGGSSRGSSTDPLLGWATFPWQQSQSPVNDGVVMSFTTIPGGTPPFDQGDTLVHEVGHWCGLYHTFQGGCTLLNDRVADTPQEATANFGCPLSRDTCPASGQDPIHNFMDFSDDSCLNNFTPGQETRMNKFLQIFRKAAIH